VKLWFGRRFEAERDPSADKDDGLAGLRQRLVQQSLCVAECARQGIVGHNAASNLVRDEDHRTAKVTGRFREVLRRTRRIEAAQKKLAEPKRHAIDHDKAIRAGFAPEGLGQRDRFFHKRPARIPRGGVASDALCHLRVTRLRRRDQDWMAPGGFGELLRVAAFARPRAAEDEKTADRTLGTRHDFSTRVPVTFPAVHNPLQKSNPQSAYPTTWNCVIEKETLNFKELEHVGIEKAGLFYGHDLIKPLIHMTLPWTPAAMLATSSSLYQNASHQSRRELWALKVKP
jgi:hypothetical protein